MIGDSGLKMLRWASAKQVTNSIGLKYAHRLAVPQTPCLLLQAHNVVSNPDSFGMIASGKKKRSYASGKPSCSLGASWVVLISRG
jgi:hypothetical protein